MTTTSEVMVEFTASGWSTVSQIYHENRESPKSIAIAPTLSEHLEYGGSSIPWKSEKMALFGCREWKQGVRPTKSPHGNNRAVVAVTSILTDSDDYLLPLKQLDGKFGRLEQSVGWGDNFYFEFIYVKQSDVKALGKEVDTEWIANWRIYDHPYLRLRDHKLEYAREVGGHKVWYKLLVPYKVVFDTGTIWEEPDDIGGWDGGARRITEKKAAAIAMKLKEAELLRLMGSVAI